MNSFMKKRMSVLLCFCLGTLTLFFMAAGITPDYAFPQSDWIIFYMATL